MMPVALKIIYSPFCKVNTSIFITTSNRITAELLLIFNVLQQLKNIASSYFILTKEFIDLIFVPRTVTLAILYTRLN